MPRAQCLINIAPRPPRLIVVVPLVCRTIRAPQAKIAADQARVSKLEEVLSGLDNQDNNQDNNQDTAGATSNAGEGQRKNQLDALNVSHQGDANASLVITEQGTTDI